MLKVHVWMRDAQHIGHTALTVEDIYVSFWPDGAAGKKDIKIKTTHPGAFMNSLKDDIYNEGNRHPTTVTITSSYHQEALLDHIEKLQREIPSYQLARNNCSHIVAECLFIACGKKPSFVPNASAYAKAGRIFGRGIWTPDQVLRYARELAK